MSLAPDTLLGLYRIIALVGEGGMGQVYRARDTRLDRDVALKVLPEALASDPERIARFEREARTLAALNHPHIAQIHGFEDSSGVKALVMEYVDGPTLADLLVRRAGPAGPAALPLEEALPIATQIAEALEAAHELGIIHRDLKPANIKVRPDGTVKVLDFGLAKAMEPVGSGQQAAGGVPLSQSPTITSPALVTGAGMILGTAAYMSPEQAKGRPADKRSDVWAFGAVLYEMLTGARAFTGDDMVDVLGAVARLDPDWTKLPATTPASIRLLVQQCLTKDRKTRLGDIAGALFILRGHRALATSPSDESIAARHPRGGRRVLLWATAAAVVGVLAGLAAAAMGGLPRSEPPVAPLVAFEVDAPVSDEGGNGPYLFAVSPDGRSLVARVRPPGAEPSDAARDLLWVRPIDRVEGTFLQGTEGATWPCWSPDGRSLAFFVGGELRMMDAGGGPQQVLAGAANGANIGRGCTWNAQGTIVFVGDPAVGPFRVPASGGSATPLALVGKPRGVLSYRYPVFLPDGEHILFHLESASADESGIYVVSIDSGEIRRIGPSSIGPRFSPPDLLLFGQDGVLMAQRFDTGRLGLVGTPVRVAGDLDTAPEQAAAGVSVSANGVLAYRPGRSGVNRVLAWIDRLGQRSGLVGPAAAYVNPRLSPDDSRLAVAREDAGADIWIVDLARATSTRLTFDAATEDTPVWSPDGQRIAFVSNRRGGVFDIYVKNANGTGDEELLFASADHKMVNDWSADGRYLVFEAQNAATKTDLWALPLAGERRAMKLLGTPFTEQAGALSPDGRWLAYMSDELGSPQVFVQAFPASGGKWQVSNTPRAAKPIWGADSKALFYDAGGRLMQVDVSATKPVAELTWGRSSSLFAGLLPLFPHNFDVTRDGSRFLVLSRDRPDRVEPIVVMLNWQAGVASQGRSGSDP